MAVVEVTSRQFRDRQKALFDLADKGEKIIIRRGRKSAYTLIPVDDDDLYFTPEILEKIDRSVEQAKRGEVITFDTVEDAIKYFESCKDEL
jgi:hypothetical protein